MGNSKHMDKNTNIKNKFIEYRKRKLTRVVREVIDLRKIDKIADILCPSVEEISEELSLIRRK